MLMYCDYVAKCGVNLAVADGVIVMRPTENALFWPGAISPATG
jgi:hypothetical protein